ncbi:MAG: pyruvate kinase [bacterium]|nr:pyruvate kinase [bacterium]MDT8365925.1 pyruvate kinase [bacterium]
MRKTRIVCTIGPAASSTRMLEKLIRAGMDVARLNMAHGTYEEHLAVITRLRSISRRLNSPVGIILDLAGVKLRISKVNGSGVVLEKGAQVLLRQGRRPSTSETLFIPYTGLTKDLKEGHRVLIDDGRVELVVTGSQGNALIALVREGGTLTSNKGVNLPDTNISTRSFTSRDRDDLAFGIMHGVDAFGVSFVSMAEDVTVVEKALNKAGYVAPLIAKIERPAALENIEEILDVSDGIMVARGDLAVEVSASAVPIIQKDLILRAAKKNRFVITATQMLESMIHSSVPTRAEAADVANAVLDGSDAVMLSAESSVGKYPVKAVQTMDLIVREAEENGKVFRTHRPTPEPVIGGRPGHGGVAMAEAAVSAARRVGAQCIIVFTRSGFTAGLLSRFRPAVPIIAFTSQREAVDRMKFYWGVVPIFMEHLDSTDTMIAQVQRAEVEKALIKGRHARRGDIVVISASLPMAQWGKTKFLKVHKIL